MKICLIGNSHAGAIKLAWNDLSKNYPSIEIFFFARGGEGMRDFLADGKSLVPKTDRLRKTIEFTSGGFSEINENNFDIFVLYGLSFGVIPFFTPQFYSEKVKSITRIDRFEKSTCHYLFKLLMTITSKPIFIAHSPFPAEQFSKSKHNSTYLQYEEEINWYNNYFQGKASFVPQPDVTIARGRLTKNAFSKGSLKLETGDKDDNEPHPDVDTKHMNKKYGEVWLHSFIKPLLS